MTISTRKRVLGGLVAASMFVALAGCASAPTDTETTSSAGGDVVEGFMPCLISDAGGWNDKSFNQSAKEGMDRAVAELGVEALELESTSENDYAPNMETAVSEGCTLIVSVGFNLSAATVESALANPEVDYAIIDDWADNDFDGTTDAPNVKPLVFDTAQAAYLGGYA
ncbi:MAG TPA: BMP family ABC transporter substrate-binding protein, partial [Microbacterium sp.]|nr:BMP family ABC transporter substrate-binding protein [Microbacterium sp.]